MRQYKMKMKQLYSTWSILRPVTHGMGNPIYPYLFMMVDIQIMNNHSLDIYGSILKTTVVELNLISNRKKSDVILPKVVKKFTITKEGYIDKNSIVFIE